MFLGSVAIDTAIILICSECSKIAPDPRRDVSIVVRCVSDERFDVGIVNYRTNCVTCKYTLVSDVTLKSSSLPYFRARS